MKRFLFGQYLNAPANKRIDNMLLRDVISFIGKQYGNGKGSSFAKAKRYLNNKIPGCKTAHIKKMLNSVPNRMRNKNDDEFMFRFSINSYTKIFAKIVELIDSNFESFSDDIKKEILLIKAAVLEPKYTYSELLIHEPLISLNKVCVQGKTDKHREIAQKIKEGIESADKKYKI